MKTKLYFTFILSSLVIACRAQDTIVISEKVGNVIDSIEKAHYRLFPYFSSKIFITGVFVRDLDSTIMLVSKLKKDSIAKKTISLQEFEMMKRNIKQTAAIVIPKPKAVVKKDTVFVRCGLKKNVIYSSLSIIPIGAAITGNIERMLFENRRTAFKSIWMKAYGGAYAVWEGSGQVYGLALTSLSGTGNHHVELNFGLSFVYDKSSWRTALSNYNYFVSNYGPDYESKPNIRQYLYFLPGGAVGYRYQQPNRNFVFRVGLGFPEVLYLSLGFCF